MGYTICNPEWVPRDSNPGPTGYEPAALTAELGTHANQKRVMGFEPTTFYLEGRRSTPELHPHGDTCRGEWICDRRKSRVQRETTDLLNPPHTCRGEWI
jgi:hypothetical protein